MMPSIRRFLEGMSEGYYALPPAERRAAEIMGWINLVGSIGVIVWMIRDHRKYKKLEVIREANSRRRQAEHDKKMAALNGRLEEQRIAFRAKMKEIADRALNPSEADLEDFRAKLLDPNHVWEL